MGKTFMKALQSVSIQINSGSAPQFSFFDTLSRFRDTSKEPTTITIIRKRGRNSNKSPI